MHSSHILEIFSSIWHNKSFKPPRYSDRLNSNVRLSVVNTTHQMSVLMLGTFVFAPAVAIPVFYLVAPMGFWLGVAVAIVALVVAFYLWPLVAFALCWPFQSQEFRRDFRKHFRRKDASDE